MKRPTDNRAAQLITMAGYLARGAVKEELRASSLSISSQRSSQGLSGPICKRTEQS
jgi:hypothetical protein